MEDCSKGKIKVSFASWFSFLGTPRSNGAGGSGKRRRRLVVFLTIGTVLRVAASLVLVRRDPVGLEKDIATAVVRWAISWRIALVCSKCQAKQCVVGNVQKSCLDPPKKAGSTL